MPSLVEDFCNKLEGFYDNWTQASSNPAKYAHCKLRWERISDNELTSKPVSYTHLTLPTKA